MGRDLSQTIINRKPSQAPKSRKELLYWLWFACKGQSDVDVFKAGPYYVVKIQNFLCGSKSCRIDMKSFEEWLYEITCMRWAVGLLDKNTSCIKYTEEMLRG